MKFLIFQKLTYNHISFIIYLIFCVILAILESYITKDEQEKNNDNRGHFYLTIIIIIFVLSDFLSLIPYFIKKNLANNKIKVIANENKTALKSDDDYIFNDAYEVEKKKKSKTLKIFTFIVGLTDFLGHIIYFFYYFYSEDDSSDFDSLFNSDIVFQILMQYILSAIILKTYFYKHHYLSIIINAISLIILLIFDIFYVYDLLEILIFLIPLVCFALENTYGKKAMIYGFLSPFNLLIYRGVYKLIFLIVFLATFIPIEISKNNNFFGDINDFSEKEALISFSYFIFYFLKDLFNFIIIDRFSPNHLALSLLIEKISYLIAYIINYSTNEEGDYELWLIFIRIFIYIILFIAALIHNEIFIITKWGLGESKLFMDEKVKEEILLSNPDIDINVLKRYDSMVVPEKNIINDMEKNKNDNYVELDDI